MAQAMVDSVGQCGAWDFYGPDIETFRPYARIVVEAMREPTDLMGLGLSNMPDQPYKPGSHSATQIWRAMIDAALA